MTGTLINSLAIIAGSIIGVFINQKIPERYIKIIFQSIGLFTLCIGIYMSVKTNHFFLIIMSMIGGSVLGELINIEKYIDKLGIFLKKKVKSTNSGFSEGFVTALLLYCMGSVAILGAIEEGLGNAPNLLFAKSVMDGVSSIALASALGFGVAFSSIPLLLYQGGLTLLTMLFGNYFSENIITELSAIGGLLLIGMGINVLGIAKIKVLNMLPALGFIVVLMYFFG